MRVGQKVSTIEMSSCITSVDLFYVNIQLHYVTPDLSVVATSDWSKTGISMATGVDEHRPQLADFNSKFAVVFVDTTGYLNLCADMYEWIYDCVSSFIGRLLVRWEFLNSIQFKSFINHQLLQDIVHRISILYLIFFILYCLE